MTEAWLCAVLAARVARLRTLAGRGGEIGKHLDDLEHLARAHGPEGFGELVRAARGGGAEPIEAIVAAVPALPEGRHLIPSQAVLVNLAPIGRAEGAAVGKSDPRKGTRSKGGEEI